MRRYESVVVFDGRLNDGQLATEVKKIEGVITTNKGEGVNVANWGKKKIAYQIAKQDYGHFVAFEFDSPNHDVVSAVGGILRITDSVLKFQSHRKDIKVRKFKGNPKKIERVDWETDDFLDDAQN